MLLDGKIFDFPAVTLSVGGKIYTPDSEFFECDELSIRTSWEKRDDFWYKRVEVTKKCALPTPDYLEVDRQKTDDAELKMCGYVPSFQRESSFSAEEEGSGYMPGCGYPLIGKEFFISLAHPAGFNTIEDEADGTKTYVLRHHPAWQGDKLEVVEAVMGFSDDPEQMFRDYLADIREPLVLEPFFAFCSFWSDPYQGNYEYSVTGEAMHKFIDSYVKLGLDPDVYTFDAGWADRKSFFEPKPGLEPENYSKLSLWISHNGPMGIDPEFIRQQGFAVGKGRSSGYCGEGYGVLLDKGLEEKIGDRFAELAKSVSHFKIDWDNECASCDQFKDEYPTVNHVREAYVNAVGRIMKKIRKVNPSILVRVGAFWPSPWWLIQGQQIFLCNSGDSEYISLPTLHQRAAAATHRDFMYYIHFVRDNGLIPLNSLDNHEFPNSIRNVFLDDDNTWMDNLMHCLLRGSTYHTWTLQPESLTDFRISSMRQVMQFARDYKERFIVKYGKLFGGNPGAGEVYGFKQDNWILLRNPAPVPQEFELPAEWGNAVQFYPDYRKMEKHVMLLPEEVKVITLTNLTLPYDVPFQMIDGKVFFPASKRINETIGPYIDELHQVPEIVFSKVTLDEEKGNLLFSLKTPYRINPLELRLAAPAECKIRVVASRYAGIHTSGSSFAPAMISIPVGVPGYGEFRNPENIYDGKTAYYSVPVPPGGETYYHISFGGSISKADFKLWCFGYEGRSRDSLECSTQLLDFDKSAAPQHPAGFPVVEKLVFE
ncbi:MAG: hypothetical protein IJW08_01805 [Lentisphaeria bacterium]|nr:hypothetical protein [Lentisphaeria bacterium]